MDRLSYTVDELAELSGISRSVLYEHHIATGNLTPRYPSSRPVFLADEVRAWLASLGTEPPKRQKRSA